MVTVSNIIHTSQHAALLVQDRSGNTSCFNCIIETHQTKAYNLARRMLDDWSLAEDAFRKAWCQPTAHPQNFAVITSPPG